VVGPEVNADRIKHAFRWLVQMLMLTEVGIIRWLVQK